MLLPAPCLPPQYCLCPPNVPTDTENQHTATPGLQEAAHPLCRNTGRGRTTARWGRSRQNEPQVCSWQNNCQHVKNMSKHVAQNRSGGVQVWTWTTHIHPVLVYPSPTPTPCTGHQTCRDKQHAVADCHSDKDREWCKRVKRVVFGFVKVKVKNKNRFWFKIWSTCFTENRINDSTSYNLNQTLTKGRKLQTQGGGRTEMITTTKQQ